MQSISSVVLKPLINPGVTPIFIISSKTEGGHDLSVLLSAHVNAPRAVSRLGGVINQDNNYFNNIDTIRVTRSIGQGIHSSFSEGRDKFKLMMDEGFANGKLWGLQCDFDLFFGLQLDNLYSNAQFFFIYSTDDKALELYREKIEAFELSHAHSSYILHSNSITFLPELVLQQLRFAENIFLSPLRDKPHVSLSGELIGKVSNDPLHQRNWLYRDRLWFEGDDLLVVLICRENYSESRLLNKINLILSSFLSLPRIQIICNDGISRDIIQSSFSKINDNGERIVVSEVNGGLSATLNTILSNNHCPYVVVDNLSVDYSFSKVLLPFKDNIVTPVFSFAGLISQDKYQSAKISLADILTTKIIEDNIIFARHQWQQIGGFDSNFSDDVTIWDFAIRLMQQCDGYALEVPAEIRNGNENYTENQTPHPESFTFSKRYTNVIEKHRTTFQSCINDLVELISVKQHAPQEEIKSLNYKLATVGSLLSHSKDEVKALNELSHNLQKRIQELEDKWFYRVGKKINRYKKIFFKKKAPGTSTLKKLLRFVAFVFSKPGFKIFRKVIKKGLRKSYLIAEDRPVKIIYLDDPALKSNSIETYHDWIKAKLDPRKLEEEFNGGYSGLLNKPTISIVMPVYNPPVKLLKQAIESVVGQLYENWELCIADDCSPNPQVRKLLHAYSAKYGNIKVCYREVNGHISACSNSALSLATGEYIVLMDHDDLISENCLYEIVKHINEHPESDIIYSDEDKVDEAGMHSVAHFKPDWAPHNLLSRNYFGHVVALRKAIVDVIGGFRLGFEGSQDYDLLLRATEASQKIGHIPKVLYHWRIHGMSAAQSEDVKPYAYIAAKKALEEALQRRNTPGDVQYLSGLRGYRIRYKIERPGKVSIIIPTKDQVRLLKNAVDSIFKLTDYSDYEVIVLNNNSSSNEFFKFVQEYSQKYPLRFRCTDANFPFNFSKLMNIGVKECDGEYILFLNNDVEVIHEDWLSIMVSHTQHNHVGAVGVKLLYPDDTVQHAGVVVGLGGVAGHAFVNSHKDDPGYFNYIQSMNNYSALTAACLMCRRAVYDEVAGMDETFEVEYNDVDLCLKFMSAGYYNVYLPDVELYHYESATRGHPHQSRESWERHVKEINLFKHKWQSVIDRDPNYNPNLNLGVHDFGLNFSA